jgi:hypothetical protein
MRVAAFLVLLVAGVHSAAATETAPAATTKPPVAAVLKDFGLFGAWAVNCAEPATPANPHVSIFEMQPDTVVERHDLGPEYETNSYRVVAAAPLSKTRVSVDVVFKPGASGQQPQRLIFRVEHDTRRTIFNRIDNGAVVVKDGVVLGRGARTPLLHRCG